MSRIPMFSKRRRMMSCRRVGQKLQAYLDGEVDDLNRARITQHLEECRRCGMELDVYTEIKASLRRRDGAVDHESLARLRSFSQQLVESSDRPSGFDEAPPSD